MGKKIKNYLEHHRTNSNNVNKGQPIYYKNTLIMSDARFQVTWELLECAIMSQTYTYYE